MTDFTKELTTSTIRHGGIEERKRIFHPLPQTIPTGSYKKKGQKLHCLLCVLCNESFCGGSFLIALPLLSFDNSYNRIQDGNAFRHSTPGNRVLYKATAPVDEWDTNPYYTANNVCRTSVPHLPPVLFHMPRLPVVRHVPDKKRLHGYSSHFPNTSMRFAEKHGWSVSIRPVPDDN